MSGGSTTYHVWMEADLGGEAPFDIPLDNFSAVGGVMPAVSRILASLMGTHIIHFDNWRTGDLTEALDRAFQRWGDESARSEALACHPFWGILTFHQRESTMTEVDNLLDALRKVSIDVPNTSFRVDGPTLERLAELEQRD